MKAIHFQPFWTLACQSRWLNTLPSRWFSPHHSSPKSATLPHSMSQWEPSVAVQKCQHLTLACWKRGSKSLCGGGRKSNARGHGFGSFIVGAWDGILNPTVTLSPHHGLPNAPPPIHHVENVLPFPLHWWASLDKVDGVIEPRRAKTVK